MVDSKPKLTPEQKLRRQLKELRQALALRDAMRLAKYPEPTPVDVAAGLKASTKTSRYGVSVIDVFAATLQKGFVAAHPMQVYARSSSPVYNTALDALIALRNRKAFEFAEQLLAIDQAIDDERKRIATAPVVVEASSEDATPVETTNENQ